jgi:hypothetical protein
MPYSVRGMRAAPASVACRARQAAPILLQTAFQLKRQLQADNFTVSVQYRHSQSPGTFMVAGSTRARRSRRVQLHAPVEAPVTSRRLQQLAGFQFVAALLLAATLLAPTDSAFAQTYTVQVNPTLNDLDIKVEHVAQSTMLIMKLTNNTDTRVRCELRYDASPQTPRRSTVFLNPGSTEQNVFRAQRRWFSVTVNVECNPAPR